jgi:Uma2 family endonuclease
VIAIQKSFPRITPGDYLDWEEQQDLRYEYINGEVYAMSGGSANHGEIAANFIVFEQLSEGIIFAGSPPA